MQDKSDFVVTTHLSWWDSGFDSHPSGMGHSWMEQAPSPQCPGLRRDRVSLCVVSPASKEKVGLHLQQAQDDFADLCQHFSNTEVMADTTGLGFHGHQMYPQHCWYPGASALPCWHSCTWCTFHPVWALQALWQGCLFLQGRPPQPDILRTGILCLLSPQVAGSLAQGSKPFSPASVRTYCTSRAP